ncbi:MAG: DUF2092 domain-containing protein [Bryobacterales bacterium]|nr:DUF2092 domain-containing protein [Bryobacterales bacterium]
MRFVYLSLLFTGACLAVDQQSTAQALLEKSADSYGRLDSCQLQSKTTLETVVDGKPAANVISEMRFAARRPGRILIEIREPESGEWVRVSDGKKTREYKSQSNQKSERDASIADFTVLWYASPLAALEQMSAKVREAKILPDERLTIGNRALDCHVIEATYTGDSEAPPIRYWIDKRTNLVVRQVQGPSDRRQTIEYIFTGVNQPLPDTVFAMRKQ